MHTEPARNAHATESLPLDHALDAIDALIPSDLYEDAVTRLALRAAAACNAGRADLGRAAFRELVRVVTHTPGHGAQRAGLRPHDVEALISPPLAGPPLPITRRSPPTA